MNTNKKKKVHFFTLGCKINIYDSEILKDKFISAGYELVNNYTDEADIVIINSCTVTAKADKKFRDYARKVKKYNKKIIIAAVGCYTQLETDKIITKDENKIDIILGSNNKFEILTYLDKYFEEEEKEKSNTDATLKKNKSLSLEESIKSTKAELKILHTDKTEFYDYNISNFMQHTRAFLKVQDGCDNYCTYCTIPKARGKSRSKPIHSVIKDTKNLVKNGYKEIVISGIDLGSYSYLDKESKTTIDLAKLIKEMLKVEGFRLRISSIEPWCLTDELIDLLISEDRIVPHFHIPLQSGSDKILKKMNRKYDTIEFKKVIDKLVKKSETTLISTDIIVGFPSEEEKDFEQSILFLENTPISYAHVFSYSDRPFASSTKLKEKVHSKTIKQRSKQLHEISDKKRFSFYEKCIKYDAELGSGYNIIIEKIILSDKTSGITYYQGVTENYIPVKFYINDNSNNDSNEKKQGIDIKYLKGTLVKGITLLEIDFNNDILIGVLEK